MRQLVESYELKLDLNGKVELTFPITPETQPRPGEMITVISHDEPGVQHITGQYLVTGIKDGNLILEKISSNVPIAEAVAIGINAEDYQERAGRDI